VERENRRLNEKLRQAETIIEVQKKFRDPGHSPTRGRRKELMGAVAKLVMLGKRRPVKL